MAEMLQLSDLTTVSVDIQFKLNTSDVILIGVTGGVGYLIKTALDHYSTKEARSIALQEKNLVTLIGKAQEAGASSIFVRVHPKVSIVVPAGGRLRRTNETDHSVDVRISWPTPAVDTTQLLG
jgi:hypothetical protein